MAEDRERRMDGGERYFVEAKMIQREILWTWQRCLERIKVETARPTFPHFVIMRVSVLPELATKDNASCSVIAFDSSSGGFGAGFVCCGKNYPARSVPRQLNVYKKKYELHICKGIPQAYHTCPF